MNRKPKKPRSLPKPILRSEKTPKKIKKQNHYRPGFVYIFHDPLAVVAKDITRCKVCLSGKPKRRRYYLSEEYQSNLIIKAKFSINKIEAIMQTIMEETDVSIELLTTLVDGALDEEGETMLWEMYKITAANFSESIAGSPDLVIFSEVKHENS